MDDPGILRTVARLDIRASRAEQAHTKLERELKSVQDDLKRTTDELEQVTRLADIFYDLSQRLGAVVDYLLQERGASESGCDQRSAKSILDSIMESEKAGDVGGKDKAVSENAKVKVPDS
ncbi:hypothetical protein POX_c04598 [Penicillium oxalicum]|uniref:hypothetical protein n=1 Tax=Penicillium oxalicum TaxID=69781 RepID=UPI0020B795F8|nr:hypothetical protein POX_c04598 [Penicillium oxalicum]KAI2791722.1 hypothetical protein POX_c04598 [Penicillium oxalicum]